MKTKVKLNLIERFAIARSAGNGDYLVTSLNIWAKKRDRYLDKYQKTGFVEYEHKARECEDNYRELLDLYQQIFNHEYFAMLNQFIKEKGT